MIRLFSPAKINLGLWVRGRRPDGFHEIATVFHTIDLGDEIFVEEGPLCVRTSSGIPMEENLVYKALLEFGARLGSVPELSVYIKKNVPEGAGLGGGSSNVATVLRVANELLGKPMSEEELMDVAASVSSDAPFFFIGGTALGTGRGEVLRKLKPLKLTITLVLPSVRSSTARVYSALHERHFSPNVDPDEIAKAVEEGRYEFLRNDLGELACVLYPEIGEVVRFLEHIGLRPLVSGSGSAVFYIGKPSAELRLGAKLRGWKVIEVRSWLGV